MEIINVKQKEQYERYRRLPLDGDFHLIMSKYPNYTNTPRTIATIENMMYWHDQIENNGGENERTMDCLG